MAVVTIEVTEEGIRIPISAAALFGCRVGDRAEVEVRPLPSAEELRRVALHYAAHRLGDAVFVGDPSWVGDGWVLPLRVRHREGDFGHLFMSPDGAIVESRSTPRTELMRAVDAASADAQAT
jgi:hypothetical protein